VPEAVRLQNDRPLRIDPNRGYSPARTTLKVLNDIYEFRAAPSNAPLASSQPSERKPRDLDGDGQSCAGGLPI